MSTVTAPRAAQRRISFAAIARSGIATWLVAGALLLGLTIHDPSQFWSSSNIATVLAAMVVLGLVSVGQNLVVLTGGIDLAVGSTATLAGLLTAIMIDGYPIRTVPVIVIVLLLGMLIGAGHGLLVAKAKLPPFVVTLGTFYLIQGIGYLITTSPTGQVTRVLSRFAIDEAGPIPYVISVLVVAMAVGVFLLRRTTFGRNVYAVGGDEAAARSSGVPVDRTLLWAYVLCGMLAAAAGILLAARATLGSPNAGQGLELSSIAVVVIGGSALTGGRGSLFGTLGGVLLFALINTSFTLLQVEATLNELIRALVIIAAAAIFVARRERR